MINCIFGHHTFIDDNIQTVQSS